MYLALYRKYRPKTFDDVISQEHITTTLKNQIISGTAAHAYLFTGSRGTGKTTCAKILSMAVNCLNPRNGNPCLECEACREIESGAATDIVEMDAASNNGVDDVRQLRDEVAYTPVSCKYRVYIIDEVHMLSAAAFNALLKTLEEPPAHVKFILATTELHKVPATIISRCQRFEFRRIDTHDSVKRLLDVAAREGVTLDEDAAELISRLSDGGMRDALSLLDRCVGAEERVSADTVRECAGVADNRHLFSFSEMTARGDASGCLRLLNELHKGSKDMARIVEELSGHYRDLMLYKTVPGDKELLSALPDEYPELERVAGMYSLEDILRCLSLLRECADNLGKTKQRRTLAEMCLVRMCLGLEANGEGTPRGAVSHASGARGAPPSPVSGGAVSIVPIELPKEEFKPTPLEDMSPKDAATLSKLRALNEETVKIAKENSMARRSSARGGTALSETPPPVMDAAPALTEPDAAPALTEPDAPSDLPEPPPEEALFIPGEADAAETAAASIEKTADKAEEKADEAPRGTLGELTDERWREIVAGVYPMTRTLLADSAARLDGNIIVIRSDSRLLIDAAKRNDLGTIEAELSEALGGVSVKVRVEAADQREEAKEKTPVEELLEKAKRADIEIIIK